jgi:hypothetical protein
LPEGRENPGLGRYLLWPVEALVILYVALDSIFTPLFLPVIRWTAKLRLIIRLQAIVEHLPPYGILGLLAVPFAIAEPAKVYALVLVATGHLALGLGMFVLAYLLSLVVMERIYDAGREKLRTIIWFAKLMDWLVGFRDSLIAWVRSTQAWAFAARVKQRARGMIARVRLRLRVD